MKRLRKILLYLTLGLVTLLGVALAGVFIVFPRTAPAPDLKIEPTAERIERGRYLVRHVAGCLDCHSERDWTRYGGPLVTGTEGRGAPLRVLRPSVYSANITPHGVGSYTDGELVRAITAGINRDGDALHPLMPYDAYARMTEEDAFATVAYVRTLQSIAHDPPFFKDVWPIRLIGRVLPKPYRPPPPPDPADTVARGEYLTSLAQCDFCHGSDLSGGRQFGIPDGGEVVSSNITPTPTTKPGSWSRENFVGVFKSFAGQEWQQERVPAGSPNTVMPWHTYAGMTEEDLGAIYDFLQTVEPVEPATP